MALEGLKYGNFKPQTVSYDSRALPGFGGDPTAWADYKFQVEALIAKEAKLSETERKKLGPLGLRLVDRLTGPALQLAKQLGVPTLAEDDGVAQLLKILEAELLPLRRQAAMELYNAGTTAGGVLSRQWGEPMSSYLLRREAWWQQLQELDNNIQVSEEILGEQTLVQSGLQPMEIQMVRTVCKNEIKKKELSKALRDQFGTVHEREKSNKGKGYGKWSSKSSYVGSGKGYGYYTAEHETNANDETPEEHYATEESYEYDDEVTAEEIYEEEQQELDRIEEDVVCWYSEQGILPQTCAEEDLEMVYNAVEAEHLAYYAKGLAHRRGVSMPAGASYQTTNLTPQERQARVLAAKQRSRCKACGQMGHWRNDAICPKRKYKGKSKGGQKDGGKGKNPSKTKSKPPSPPKQRTVYFTVKDEVETDHCYMALSAEDQRRLEVEVQRLLSLPQDEVDRRFREELNYMAPTSKSPPPMKGPNYKAPPTEIYMNAINNNATYPKMFSIGHTEGPVQDHRLAASELLELRPPTPGLPVPKQPGTAIASTTETSLIATEEPSSTACKHVNQTRQGTNAYVTMITCKDCGALLKKEKKDRDVPIALDPPAQDQCEHADISWHGTNGYSWKWTCKGCGAHGSEKKIQGKPKPIPFGKAGPMAKASPSTSSSPSHRPSNIADEDFVVSVEEWIGFNEVIDKLVRTHIQLRGKLTYGEYHQIVNAAVLSYRCLGLGAGRSAVAYHADDGAASSSAGTGHALPAGHQGHQGQPHDVPKYQTEDYDWRTDDSTKLGFGLHRERTFKEIYETNYEYTAWCNAEENLGDSYLEHFQTYCRERQADEMRYMAADALEDYDSDAECWVAPAAYMVNAEEELDDADVIYLDSGCNSTCHGEAWIKRFIKKTGYAPPWLNRNVKHLNGIGGKTTTTGQREFYVNLEGIDGNLYPGEIASTEVKGSDAPLLLSIQAQQALGLVVDFGEMTIKSRTLGIDFAAVRGRRNRLLGLRLSKAEGCWSPETEAEFALMVDDEDNGPAASSTPRSTSGGTSSTTLVVGSPKNAEKYQLEKDPA